MLSSKGISIVIMPIGILKSTAAKLSATVYHNPACYENQDC